MKTATLFLVLLLTATPALAGDATETHGTDFVWASPDLVDGLVTLHKTVVQTLPG